MGRVRYGIVAAGLTVLALVGATASASTAEPPNGPDPAVLEWPVWPYQAACYGPPFDPVGVFSGPTGAEQGSRPSEIALREIVLDPARGWPGSQEDWRFVSESDQQAVFVHGRLSSVFQNWILLTNKEGRWQLAGYGTCAPRTVLHGITAATWTLSPDQPELHPNTKRIRIVLDVGRCSSGMSQSHLARKPIFRRIGTRLVMTMLVDPQPAVVHTCQGVIEPPLEVKLPGKLGDRRLYDGGTYPPNDVVEAWRERARLEARPRR